MKVKLLTPDDCVHHSEMIAPVIALAMEHSAGESNLEDILVKLFTGKAQCWCVVDDEDKLKSLGVTEIIQYQRKKSLHVITFTGDWENTGHFHPVWEEFAEDTQCDSVVAWCRSGWERKLKNFVTDTGRKYEKSYVVMELKINKEVS